MIFAGKFCTTLRLASSSFTQSKLRTCSLAWHKISLTICTRIENGKLAVSGQQSAVSRQLPSSPSSPSGLSWWAGASETSGAAGSYRVLRVLRVLKALELPITPITPIAPKALKKDA